MTIYINFTDLTEDKQDEIMEKARESLIKEYGEKELREEAKRLEVDYETLVMERTERQLYTLNYIFYV